MYNINDKITIGTTEYTIILVSSVTDNEKYLKQDNVTHLLAIQDANGVKYTVKAYGSGSFSYPKEMNTR